MHTPVALCESKYPPSDSSQIGLGTTVMTSFSQSPYLQKRSYSEVLGSVLQHVIFERMHFNPQQTGLIVLTLEPYKYIIYFKAKLNQNCPKQYLNIPKQLINIPKQLIKLN